MDNFELLREYKNTRDETIREKIIMNNLSLVSYLANKYTDDYDLREEIRSYGIIGLIKAVDTFDPDKNIKFSTYAGACIIHEICAYFRVNNKEVGNLSLDMQIYEDEDNTTLLDTIEDKTMNFQEKLLDKLDGYHFINDIFPRCITVRDIEVLKYYYGLCGYKKLKKREIAKKFNLSQTYISNIINKSLVILRHYFKASDRIKKSVFLRTIDKDLKYFGINKDGDLKVKEYYKYLMNFLNESSMYEELGTKQQEKIKKLNYIYK